MGGVTPRISGALAAAQPGASIARRIRSNHMEE
jgi:hypothetical protein